MQDLLHVRDLLVGDEDDGVVELGDHLVGVGDHVSGDEAAVKLHAANGLDFGLHGLGLFHGDDAVVAHSLHGVGNEGANLGVVGRNGGDLCDVVLALDLLAHVGKGAHGRFHSLIHAAAEHHGVGAGRQVAQALADHGLGEQGGGGGAVAGDVVGLDGDFLHQLSAHVLKGILKLDLFGDGHAVVGDEGRAVLLLEHDVAALGAEGDLDGICEGVDAGFQGLAGVVAVFELLCHNVFLLNCSALIPQRPKCRSGAR